ncbi:hypothetical protein [Methylobacterium frigidaeris]|uniref:Uncharacterized protein n=1 Tax=Methylobacterium frigidaeris TaxID=2038277 RepID=A0AA37HA34_9HYPH|nr:hypothetical protein [Methylobacterium frigidaeris]PIK74599.1 hypothetical protein CS379_01580 [Methylobacterium frigidaeris]GJD61804.1 hypothetical protein MPEAHAMD_1951 [Methylobacterium frigidaeris]
MASPLPLVRPSDEPLRLQAAPRQRLPSRLPAAMLVRGLAVIAGLGMPVAAARLADLVHPAPAVSPAR